MRLHLAIALPTELAASTPGPRNEGGVVTAGGLVRRYGEGATAVEALRGVDLGIGTGRLTAIMGPSGSRKSTLMHLLAGLDPPTEGSIVIDGTEITKLTRRSPRCPTAARS